MKPFQIPATITKISTMSTWLRIQFDPQELMPGDKLSRLFSDINKLGWLSYNVHMIEADDIIDLPPLKKTSKEKSKAQQLRHTLYAYWCSNDQGFDKADDHYNYMMDNLIEYYKSKIDGE